jgi:hypothetical protein
MVMTKAPENVPRRMRRFYREAEHGKKQINSEYGGYSTDSSSYGNGRKSYFGGDNYSGSLEAAVKKVDNISDGRKKEELTSIPSMDYEDLNLDEKNSRELKKIGQNEMKEKLALFEIEKFKKEKNRLPTKDETTKLAENVFTQVKTKKESESSGLSRRELRQNRRHPVEQSGSAQTQPNQMSTEKPSHIRRGQKQDVKGSEEPMLDEDFGTSSISDIKDLLGEDEGKKKDGKSEVGLDSDLDEFDDSGELEDIGELDFDLEGKKKKKKN